MADDDQGVEDKQGSTGVYQPGVVLNTTRVTRSRLHSEDTSLGPNTPSVYTSRLSKKGYIFGTQVLFEGAHHDITEHLSP